MRGLLAGAAMSLALPSVVTAAASREERAAARLHYERAVNHYNLGEFADAATEFREVYKSSPQAALLYDTAQAYRLANDRDKAVFFYQSFLRSEPGSPHRSEVERRIHELSPEALTTTTTAPPPSEKRPGTPTPPDTKPSTPEVKPATVTRPDTTPSEPDAKPEAVTKPLPADSKATAGSAVGNGGSERLRPVVDIIRKNRAGFRGCFDRWSSQHPGIGGTVTLSFYLDPDGNLDQADADAKGFDAPEVLDCIIGYAHSLHYPASPNGKFTRFTYPFDFKATK
jgi:tetratricopeptide repeat protein